MSGDLPPVIGEIRLRNLASSSVGWLQMICIGT